MGESHSRRIPKLGQKVADELIEENPPPDKVYERAALLARVGLSGDETSRTSLLFFQALNERMKDKAGRMYLVAGPGRITFTRKEDTVAASEALTLKEADRALSKHIHTVELVTKHLSPVGRTEAAQSIARMASLAAQLRMAAQEAAEITNVLSGGAK